MRHIALLCLLLGILLIVLPAASQNVNMEHPNDIQIQKQPRPEEIRAHAAKVQLQRDSKELAELCNSLPADLSQVQQGFLPKDIDKKLRHLVSCPGNTFT